MSNLNNYYLDTDLKTFYSKGTLAHFLDNRTNPIGEPTADNLPKTINPAQFLWDKFLSRNAVMVKVNITSENAKNIHLLSLLRRLMPPSQHIFLYLIAPKSENKQVSSAASTVNRLYCCSVTNEQDQDNSSYSIVSSI